MSQQLLERVAMEFDTDINGPQRMNHFKFEDPLTSPLSTTVRFIFVVLSEMS